MIKKSKQLHWPTAVVLIVVVIALAVAYLAGPSLGVPDESHSELVAGVGAFGAVVLAWMRGLFSRDTDGDGIPDVLQGGTQ